MAWVKDVSGGLLIEWMGLFQTLNVGRFRPPATILPSFRTVAGAGPALLSKDASPPRLNIILRTWLYGM